MGKIIRNSSQGSVDRVQGIKSGRFYFFYLHAKDPSSKGELGDGFTFFNHYTHQAFDEGFRD
ncbi:MAG: hypothetical protein SV062_05095 [Thermodesulfobacteriota bacterium]|nr:hypothetical protein [Thermodesulfobacteriota bacterium]